MASQFSKDGKYYAQLSTDGKLKIWNTATNKFEQEFTPDFHLTTPCVCLQFILPVNKSGSPRKKIKRRDSNSGLISPFIVLGTTSGLLLCYSIAKGELDFTIDSKTNQSISCLSWQEGSDVFSAADQHVLSWNLENKSIKSKWKAGNEKLTSVLLVPDTQKLLTASKNIKLWNISSKEVIATFTGHSSEVTSLCFINPSQNDGYFFSASKNDRIVSCWNLDGTKNAVSNFLTEDVVTQMTVQLNENGATQLATVTRSGVCHVYIHTLNGKVGKPLKPTTTLRVVSDSQEKASVLPIPIIAGFVNSDSTVIISHGNAVNLLFENIVLNSYEKVQCIIRKDQRSSGPADSKVSKVKTPIADNNVHYLTPHTHNNVGKRKPEGSTEVPMEKRLENLALNKPEGSSKTYKGNNVAQLLLQAIHGKDKAMLQTVFNKRDETVINNTIKRLPMTVITPLVEELTNLMQGKTLSCQTGALWLKSVLQIHAGLLISNPELSELLSPVMTSIESRLNLQTPLNKLRGRLDLLVSQLSVSQATEEEEDDPLLVFNDKASSDSELDILELGAHSESENEWLEEESDMEEDIEENGDVNSDEEMST